jgi:hypothetical protein
MSKTEKPKRQPKRVVPPDSKPKTASKPRDFIFFDSSGNEQRLTPMQQKFCVSYLESYGDSFNAIIEAGYDVYKRDKNGKISYEYNSNLIRSMARENLSKPSIIAFIAVHLKEYGFNDENVNLQHMFLINQHADLAAKKGGIDMYYKVHGKYAADAAAIAKDDSLKQFIDRAIGITDAET